MDELNILIIAPSGYGKSNLADAVRNAIFRKDTNANIHVDDKDREKQDMGEGTNVYNIVVRREKLKVDEDKADVVVEIKTKKFYDKYHEIL
jgi:predicted ATP-binding protein involved in virulence